MMLEEGSAWLWRLIWESVAYLPLDTLLPTLPSKWKDTCPHTDTDFNRHTHTHTHTHAPLLGRHLAGFICWQSHWGRKEEKEGDRRIGERDVSMVQDQLFAAWKSSSASSRPPHNLVKYHFTLESLSYLCSTFSKYRRQEGDRTFVPCNIAVPQSAEMRQKTTVLVILKKNKSWYAYTTPKVNRHNSKRCNSRIATVALRNMTVWMGLFK